MREQGRHYEQAFEGYLRSHRIPYVVVNEARRTLTPCEAGLARGAGLKSFDLAVQTGQGSSLLVDVKGRRAGPGARMSGLQSWVTEDDVRSLQHWERVWGSAVGVFVFVYWCESQPPDGQFCEVFEWNRRWYALRTVVVAAYAAVMRRRSGRWGTVHLSARDFDRLAGSFEQAHRAVPQATFTAGDHGTVTVTSP